MKDKVDIKVVLMVLTFVVMASGYVVNKNSAIAQEFEVVKISATELKARVDNSLEDIDEIKKDMREINAKLDTLLIDRGYNPKLIVKESLRIASTTE